MASSSPSAAGDAQAFPIDPALLPKMKRTFSAWIHDDLQTKLTMENSTAMGRHVSQDGYIHWLGFADWAREHINDLGDMLVMYVDDENNWIFNFFPMKFDKAAIIKQNSIEIGTELPVIGTRKVPFRNISAKVSSRTMHTVYSGSGFQMDYHLLKTPDGVAAWDMQIDAITSHVWAFVIHQALNAFRGEPSGYWRMEQLYPFGAVPTTPDDLFLYEQQHFGILNKEAQAKHKILSEGNRIMSQNQMTVANMIMSRDDMWWFKSRDMTELDYSASGPVALTNRSTEMDDTLNGVQIYPVPLQHGKLHGTVNEHALQTVVTRGSFVRFPDHSMTLPACDYRSFHRTVKYGSWSTNQLDEYDFMTFLRHCLQFNKETGEIRVQELEDLIANAPDLFSKTMQTEQSDETMERLDPLIRYDRLQQKKRHHVINCFGELSECSAKTSYLKHVAETMECAVFGELSREHLIAFEKGMELAKELQNTTPSITGLDGFTLTVSKFGAPSLGDIESPSFIRLGGLGNINGFLEVVDTAKERSDLFDPVELQTIRDFVKVYTHVVQKMHEISPNHAAFSESLIPMENRGLRMSKTVKRMTSVWYSIFSNYISGATALKSKTPGWDTTEEFLFSGTVFTAIQVNGRQAPRSGNIYDGLERQGLTGRITKMPGNGRTNAPMRSAAFDMQYSAAPSFVRHLLGAREKQGIYSENGLTEFEGRWAQSHLMRPALGVCMRFFLSQSINLQVLESYYRHNIAIPFGGINLRPAETQLMTSEILTAEGEMGKTIFSGVDSSIGFDHLSQHFSVQINWSCRPIISNLKKFLFMCFTRGVQQLGGKGNLYINDQVDIFGESNEAVELKEYVRRSHGELLGDRSNIAVLGSYNSAIEPSSLYHLDVRGNYRQEDFQGRMTESPEYFLRANKTLQYDGQPFANYVFNGFGLPNATFAEKLSFENFSALQYRNFHVHQPTTWVYVRGQLTELPSYHPWGREEDGLADKEQSMMPVERDTCS